MSNTPERAAFEAWMASDPPVSGPTVPELLWAAWQARAAVAQQPEAWGAENDDGALAMVFLSRAEAAQYCDGAEPVALGRTRGAAIAQPAYVDGVPQFNSAAQCSPTLTQCPRCNNPHHACDDGMPGDPDERHLRRLLAVRAALADMLAGWRYIRQSHGDLYGVGWDRAQEKAEAALGLQPGQEMPAEWFGAERGN